MTTRIGFIGTGIMGRPMAAHLAAAGHSVVIFNRRGAEVPGCTRAPSIAELTGKSEIVIMMLPGTPDVEQVLFGDGGVASALSGGKLIVDMSSISPSETRRFAERVRALGADYVDAPVSGGEAGAKSATLTIMCGGAPAAFERVKPLLSLMGKNITLVGGNGAGQTCKVCNQIIVAGTLAAVGEALLFASRAGADPAQVRQALMGGFASSRILELHGQRMVTRNFEPGFRVELHQKDLNIALSGAQELGLSLPISSACQKLFEAVAAAGGAQLDHAAILQALEALAGHPMAKTAQP